MVNNQQVKREFSAGGTVLKREGGQVFWLVQEVANRGYWALPKGHIEEGETAIQAATREVQEESGILARIIAQLTPTEYFYTWEGEKRFKKVQWYLMEYVSGSTENFDQHEIAQAAFLPFQDALAKIEYETEKSVLREANNLVTTGDLSSNLA